MRSSTLVSILLSALTLTLAAPTQRNNGCGVSLAKLDLPDIQDISIPVGVKPKYIALAIGTQNYTCSNAGNYTTAGAVSTLIDISCLYKSDPDAFEEVQDSAYDLLRTTQNEVPTLNQIKDVIGYDPLILGDHYFIPQGSLIAPMFDFTRSQPGNIDAYMVGMQLGLIPSPDGSQNIPWLELQRNSGKLSKYVFRVNTRGGQPPDTCTEEGEKRTVPYTAKYWFFR